MKSQEDLKGENGLLKQLTKAVLERALNAELTDLGYEKDDPVGYKSGNPRNGKSRKKKAISASWNWKRRAIGMGRSSRRSSPRIKRRWTGFDENFVDVCGRDDDA